MSETIILGIADGRVVKRGETLATYALGSCVGVCLYDGKNKIGGLAHIMLPSKDHSFSISNDYKFADAGIRNLLEEMRQAGADRSSIIAKIFGGAEMFAVYGNMIPVGERNVTAVIDVLRSEKIRLHTCDTGSNYGRSIWFDTSTGVVKVKSSRGEIYM